jgi:hypothetical protein
MYSTSLHVIIKINNNTMKTIKWMKIKRKLNKERINKILQEIICVSQKKM